MAERVLMKGNEAIAEAAIRAGCRHYFGYPITPQTEIAAYMAKKMPKIGGVFLQAESEHRGAGRRPRPSCPAAPSKSRPYTPADPAAWSPLSW